MAEMTEADNPSRGQPPSERSRAIQSRNNKQTSLFLFLLQFIKIIWSAIKIHWIALQFIILQILTKNKEFQIQDEEILRNKGRWAVVTGGSRGIGLEVVRKLYKCQMNIVIGCKNVTYGSQIAMQLRDERESDSGATIHACHLDLLSLRSVRQFATEVVSITSGSVHVLVNNAGVMFPTFEMTEDGLGNQMQTNHLGHFALISHLLTTLSHSGSPERCARIVNVSSVAHYGGNATDETVGIHNYEDKIRGYMDSKLCQIASSVGWNLLFRKEGLGNLKVLNVHPGIVDTGLYSNVFYYKYIVPLTTRICMTPSQGADCVVYAALSPELEDETPIFLVNSQETKPHKGIRRKSLIDTVWKESCAATHVSHPLPWFE